MTNKVCGDHTCRANSKLKQVYDSLNKASDLKLRNGGLKKDVMFYL